MKGLRLKAKTTVGTETTRWVSDSSKRLMGPKRPHHPHPPKTAYEPVKIKGYELTKVGTS